MEATRSGNTILELSDLGIEVGGRHLVRTLTLQLAKGERIGVIGGNAVGKTTLLRCLCGQLEPTEGRIVRGRNTHIAYFEQTRLGLDDAVSIQQNVAGDNQAVHWNGRQLSIFSYLENFLFFGDKQRQLVGSLSGGERARVVLAKLLLGSASLLLLDEPTNDLDVVTLGALEEMLRQFAGTSLVVTHDRYFLDRVATALLVFQGEGRVVYYPGNYSTYLRLRAEALVRDTQESSAPSPRPRRPPRPRRGLTYAEQRELDGILDQVSTAEARVAEIEAELADPELYAKRGATVPALLSAEKEARTDLQRLSERWEELETRRESAERD
jgi:ATP-binding cassette subfamily F protein uup